MYWFITAKFNAFTVEVGKGGNFTSCYEHETDVDEESVIEINCVQPLVGRTLRISPAENVNSPLVLCEVEVYGGNRILTMKC